MPPAHPAIAYDISHLLAALILLSSFALLYQRRLFALLNIYAVQSALLALDAAWRGYADGQAGLWVTALIALALNAVVIPGALHRLVLRFGMRRTVETAYGIGPTLVVGGALVTLSLTLVLPMTAGSAAMAREDIAIALSVVLLGLLVMITRRNAVIQVVGFLSIDNGLILAAVGARGMPLVVEMAAAVAVLVAALLFGIVVLRIRERFDSVDLHFLERADEVGDAAGPEDWAP